MEANVAKAEDAPILSKDLAAFALAFLNGWNDVLNFRLYKAFTLRHTGSTMNLGINSVERDTSLMKFFFGVLVHYCGGCALFKFLDTQLKGRSLTASAPVVLALQSMNDQLRTSFPDSKLHMWLLAASNGIFNTACAEKLGCLTHVITGHYQKVSTDLVLLSVQGLSKEQLRATRKSCKVLLSFFLGAVTAQAGGYLNKSLVAQCSQRRFSIMGILYAIVLLLSENSAGRLLGQSPPPEKKASS
uniref:Uncharacterized protein n=1 Tax=Alexandrium andersonii TaxID=327968 RepID=A0A7S2FZP7_9DINO|mmetsp:Transcript_37390/g.85004  ORF Transcript_37390/g.85004 Transcript_37390/m.85004 type:complete len:244 (+) Transcript_37390:82-813(+)